MQDVRRLIGDGRARKAIELLENNVRPAVAANGHATRIVDDLVIALNS